MAFSNTIQRKATARIGASLSPRRKLYANSVLNFLRLHRHRWHDGVVRMKPETFEEIADELNLDRFAVQQALDDLFALGLIDSRMSGSIEVVVPLAADIEVSA